VCVLQASAASKWLSKQRIDPNDLRNALLLELLRAREAAAHSGQAVGASGIFRYTAVSLLPGVVHHSSAHETKSVHCKGLGGMPRCCMQCMQQQHKQMCACADAGCAAVVVPVRLDLPAGLSLGVDRVADRRVAFIKQRWSAGPYRSSSSASAGHASLQGVCVPKRDCELQSAPCASGSAVQICGK
jgi:hypothetical protein